MSRAWSALVNAVIRPDSALYVMILSEVVTVSPWSWATASCLGWVEIQVSSCCKTSGGIGGKGCCSGCLSRVEIGQMRRVESCLVVADVSGSRLIGGSPFPSGVCQYSLSSSSIEESGMKIGAPSVGAATTGFWFGTLSAVTAATMS
eukprot:2713270-Amphidinium_carterae.1